MGANKGPGGKVEAEPLPSLLFFFKILFYLFMRDTEREAEAQRGRSGLHTGSPMRDSIPGPQDHTLSLRETLNH